MTGRLSIGIAGCGPAGLAAALLFERAGHRVTLVERFDRPEPLGSGLILQPTGLAVLGHLGLADAILARGRRITRMIGRTGSGAAARVVLDVGYGALAGDAFGLAVHRAALFGVLFEAVQAAGVAIETGRDIVALERGADGRPSLIDRRGRRLGGFDLVVDALGSRSPLPNHLFGRDRFLPLGYGAFWASLPWPEAGSFDPGWLEQRYASASQMAGVLPIGRRQPGLPDEAALFWSVKQAEVEAWRARGLDGFKAAVRALWPATEPLLAAIAAPEQLVFARYGHHTLPVPFAERIAFIGDSAHATSPQLGQGANMALLDALALARAVERQSDLARALADYARMRRRHVRIYQALSLLFTPFYQSDSRVLPALRDRLFAPVSRLPLAPRLLAGLVAGQFGAPLRAVGLGPLPRAVGLLQRDAPP